MISKKLYSFQRLHSIIAIFCIISIRKCEGVSAEEDLTLSWKEKQVLDKLTERVIDILPHDYMKSEIYLINWVRAADLNLQKAEEMLRENLRWRKEYKMDKILNEEFNFFEEEYPIDETGIDYEGRPILAVNVGDWDVRRLHITGMVDKGERYSMRALEIAAQKVRDAQARGESVTRFQVVWNLDGFNLVIHGCLRCIAPYIKFISAFQKYFPEMVDNVVFINAPPALESILRSIRPVANPRLRKAMKIFGTDKREWKKFLLNIIPPDQLDRSMGGTRINTY